MNLLIQKKSNREKESLDLARMVDKAGYDRVSAMLSEAHGGTVIRGGSQYCDAPTKFIPYTIVKDPRLSSKLYVVDIFNNPRLVPLDVLASCH